MEKFLRRDKKPLNFSYALFLIKNGLYYIFVCFLLCFFTGILYHFVEKGEYMLLFAFVILLSLISYGIDFFSVRRSKRVDIVYIKRVFFPFRSLLYYVFLLWNVMLSCFIAFCIDGLNDFERIESFALAFFFVFVCMYMCVLRIYYVEDDEGNGRYVSFLRL